jgi:hypothetical protein
LAEGSSIRSIERITGIHRDTIMRLGVKVGRRCGEIMDSQMRNLETTYHLGLVSVSTIFNFGSARESSSTIH